MILAIETQKSEPSGAPWEGKALIRPEPEPRRLLPAPPPLPSSADSQSGLSDA